MTHSMQLILAAAFFVSMPVVAQVPAAPEELATVKENEVTRIDRDSIKAYDSTARFEIFINWDASQGVRPPDHLARKVRYVADCKAGTLTLPFGREERLEDLFRDLLGDAAAAVLDRDARIVAGRQPRIGFGQPKRSRLGGLQR